MLYNTHAITMEQYAYERAHSVDTNINTNNKLFYNADFNFTNYDKTELQLICKHNLLLCTSFPKLVLYLFQHKTLSEIYLNIPIDKNDLNKMSCIIKGVEEYIETITNTYLSPNIVSGEDQKLLDIIERRLVQTPQITDAQRGKHEKMTDMNVSENKSKSINNNTYNYTDGFLEIQQTRRTRKNTSCRIQPQPTTLMKYGRLISIT